MWDVIKKVKRFGRKKPEKDTVSLSHANETYLCSKCNKPFTGKNNLVCNNCFSSSVETVLNQARSANKKLKEIIEETERRHQAFCHETQVCQTKQLEKIAELGRLLEEKASKEAVLSKLYYLVSKAYFEPLRITSLFYIADRRNLPSILANGILCKNLIDEKMIPHSSFADEGIQAIRSEIQVGLNSAHDYVPLYLEPKPPMLYRLQKEYENESNQNKLIYICVRKEILAEEGVFFTDRNLAAANCKFYNSIEDLANLNWEIIRTTTWGGNEEKKHIKGAEVLVPHRVSPAWFQKIVVYDEAARREISSTEETNLPIEVNRDEFYY